MQDRHQAVALMLGQLKDRERRIVIGRYGLGGAGKQTLNQLGNELGISKERVRQIELRATCNQLHARIRAGPQRIAGSESASTAVSSCFVWRFTGKRAETVMSDSTRIDQDGHGPRTGIAQCTRPDVLLQNHSRNSGVHRESQARDEDNSSVRSSYSPTVLPNGDVVRDPSAKQRPAQLLLRTPRPRVLLAGDT